MTTPLCCCCCFAVVVAAGFFSLFPLSRAVICVKNQSIYIAELRVHTQIKVTASVRRVLSEKFVVAALVGWCDTRCLCKS